MLDRDGVTYAKARVVNTFPPVLAPPIEGSTVFSCGERRGRSRAYEMDTYADERGVCVGLIRNGGRSTAGRAFLDQDFLLGSQAGHLNVNGAAGSGTKSSFLTIATYADDQRRQDARGGHGRHRAASRASRRSSSTSRASTSSGSTAGRRSSARKTPTSGARWASPRRTSSAASPTTRRRRRERERRARIPIPTRAAGRRARRTRGR